MYKSFFFPNPRSKCDDEIVNVLQDYSTGFFKKYLNFFNVEEMLSLLIDHIVLVDIIILPPKPISPIFTRSYIL